MLAGSIYTEKLAKPGGRIDRLLQSGASDRSIVEELYLATLCRFPSIEEGAELERMIRERFPRRETIQNLLYALIASREFAYNH